MNTLYLKYAVEVEKAGSITQAANNLFVSQPNLSKAVHELEESLGMPVFKRTSKGIVPTLKGSLFLKQARIILAQIENLEQFCKEGEEGRRAFAAAIPRESYIAKAAADFIAEAGPDERTEIRVFEADSIAIISGVAEGAFNLGIIRYDTAYEKYFLDLCEHRGLSCDMVWEFSPLAVMPKSHPLACNDKVTAVFLEPYTEIKFGDIQIPFIGEEKQTNSPPRAAKIIYINNRCSLYEILARVPDAYTLTSPLPEDYAASLGLVQRVCADIGRVYRDALVCTKDYSFSPLDKKFIDSLSRAKNQVAFTKYH